MILELYEQEIIAYMILGLILNFLFSFMFAMYLTKNIGIEEMIKNMGEKKQSFLVSLSLIIPYAKMLIILYRVAILQIFFLNKGLSHKEFWIYLTHHNKIKNKK